MLSSLKFNIASDVLLSTLRQEKEFYLYSVIILYMNILIYQKALEKENLQKLHYKTNELYFYVKDKTYWESKKVYFNYNSFHNMK